jgi:hypothetical protein
VKACVLIAPSTSAGLLLALVYSLFTPMGKAKFCGTGTLAGDENGPHPRAVFARMGNFG